jgi:hypothetical protein
MRSDRQLIVLCLVAVLLAREAWTPLLTAGRTIAHRDQQQTPLQLAGPTCRPDLVRWSVEPPLQCGWHSGSAAGKRSGERFDAVPTDYLQSIWKGATS